MDSIVSRYVESHPGSGQLHQRALRLFPDGVTHDLRRNSPFPLYVERAAGSAKRNRGHRLHPIEPARV
jgi:glutamate-1-semialdehyde 2,1-aminomutase